MRGRGPGGDGGRVKRRGCCGVRQWRKEIRSNLVPSKKSFNFYRCCEFASHEERGIANSLGESEVFT